MTVAIIRRGLLAFALFAGLLVAPVPGRGAAPAADADSSDIVAIVVDGTGYGHGRGMSQWGAYGWAVDQAKDWTWILDHYYGGTTLGDVNTSQTRVRVRLLGYDGYNTLGVTAGSGNVSAGGVTARSLRAEEVSANRFAIYGSAQMACSGATTLTVPDGPIARNSTNAAAVRQIQTFLNAFQAGTALAVDGSFGALTEARLKEWQAARGLPVDGVWDPDTDAVTARAQIAATGSGTWTLLTTVTGPVSFSTPNGDNSAESASNVLGVCDGAGKLTHYRGTIELHDTTSGNRVVNDVKTEDYLRGVVPKEISASWADAGEKEGVNAVRAQAVAARSYALAYSSSSWSPGQICDSQSCQVYFGAATRSSATASATNVEDTRTDAAIAATAGKVRKWPSGAVVSTEFSASNGPRTAGGTFPAVDDALGDATAKNPNHRWTRVIDADTLATKYGLTKITSAVMDESSNATYKQYDGIWFNDVVLNGTKRIDAWTFRGAFSLPSPGFTIRLITRDTTTKTFGLIGDSVGNSIVGGSAAELPIVIDGMFPTAVLDARDGRCPAHTCNGALSNGAEVAGTLPANLDLVVVELGYNQASNAGFAADIDTMMRALNARGVGQVAWVNLATAPSVAGFATTYAQRNAQLDQARSRWPNLTVLDWDSASRHAESSRWFVDHAHLSATGQANFALWLREQVRELTPPDPFTVKVTPARPLEIPVNGRGGVPVNASAVAMNVTAVDPAGWGFLTVWPCGSDKPETSNVNFVSAGAVEPNSVLTKLDATGKVCIATSSTAHVLVDVAGWFTSGYEPIVPDRIVDTRNGIGAPKAKVVPSSPLRVKVAGHALVPANASAVAMNVTAVDPAGWGFLTVWPCGSDKPETSNVNFVSAGAVEPNSVLTQLDATGEVCIATSSTTHVLVDLAGAFTSGYQPIVPDRIVDTRNGIGAPKAKVVPSSPLRVKVAGHALVPANASAVAMNVTAVDPAGWGFLTVWPCGSDKPETSNVNFVSAGAVEPNSVLTQLDATGEVCIATSSTTHVLVDLAGAFTSGYQPIVPDRIVDTRNGIGPR